MSFFRKLFGSKKEPPGDSGGPMPSRSLKLPFAPVPENGASLANVFAQAVLRIDQAELDYSVASLEFVDQFLERFRREGLSVNDCAETIFVAGCYVGQVMVNQCNGNWVRQEEAGLPEGVTMMPSVVKLPGGTIADPIAKAFKRFYYGESDSIFYFYQVFTNEDKV